MKVTSGLHDCMKFEGLFAQPLFFTLIYKLLTKGRKSNEQTGTHSANGIAVGG